MFGIPNYPLLFRLCGQSLHILAMMGPAKHVSNRRCLQSRRSRILLAVVAFIAVLAVVIPPAVVVTLHKKNSMGPKAKVFVPLYVYPAPGAWTPLEEV